MKLNTLSYVLGAENTIEAGKEYYFGQLWDGNGDGDGTQEGSDSQSAKRIRI